MSTQRPTDKQIETAAEAAALQAEWLEDATPPEVDEQLANLWGEASKLRSQRDGAKLALASGLGIRSQYVTRHRREVRESGEELLALAETKLADEDAPRLDTARDRERRCQVARRSTPRSRTTTSGRGHWRIASSATSGAGSSW